MTRIDIGSLCTQCNKDTSFGSGRFVNRIPSETDTHSGYMCAECQQTECDRCGELTFEYSWIDDEVLVCEDCKEKAYA